MKKRSKLINPLFGPGRLFRSTALYLAAAGLLSPVLCDEPTATNRPPNAEYVQTDYHINLLKAESSSNLFVRPGLIADRNLKTVSIWAEATGLGPEDSIEFYLISPRSGHDYEALAVSYAQPSDIHAALEFIGLSSGKRVDYQKMRLWPKGERVFSFCEWQSGRDVPVKHPLEKLLVDTKTMRALPARGFCFPGSSTEPDPDNPGKSVYMADVRDPGSIVSDFNEPFTVLDTPFRRDKSAVYGQYRSNPDLLLQKGQRVKIILTPEYTDGFRRVTDIDLFISKPDPLRDATWKQLNYLFAGESVQTNTTLGNVITLLERLVASGKTPYISLRFAPGLKLNDVAEVCSFMATLSGADEGIRLEPPVAGELFYKSFLPPLHLRSREERPSQPWEIHLSTSNTLELVRVTETWPEGSVRAELEIEEFSANSIEDLKKIFSAVPNSIPVLLIFAPGETTYRSLRDIINPLLKDYSTVYVFQAGDPSTEPETEK